jgi:hypothetical protein
MAWPVSHSFSLPLDMVPAGGADSGEDIALGPALTPCQGTQLQILMAEGALEMSLCRPQGFWDSAGLHVHVQPR